MNELPALESTVALIMRVINDAASRGDGSGLGALRRRALAILDASAPPKTAAKSFDQAEIDLECRWWVSAISEMLVPAQCDAVVKALREDRRGTHGGNFDDPWDMLDPSASSARQKATATRILCASITAVAACRRYELTRRTSYLRDAVVELETTVRTEREGLDSSRLSTATCHQQRDRLEGALRRELPPSAFHFIALGVRDVIAHEMANMPGASRARGAEREQWLSRESWTDRNGEEPATGSWFVEDIQRVYDARLERERETDEAEARRRQEAAERHLRWQTARDADARQNREADDPPLPGPVAGPTPKIEQVKATWPAAMPFQPESKWNADMVAWPAHAEANALLREEANRASMEEWASTWLRANRWLRGRLPVSKRRAGRRRGADERTAGEARDRHVRI